MIDLSERVQRGTVFAASLQTMARLVHTGPSTSFAPARVPVVRRWWCLLSVVLAAGCGETSGPRSGALELTAVITGGALDPTGPGIALDGGVVQAISGNHTLMLSGLKAGSHSVTLVGIPIHCTISGANPRMVNVAAGATAQVAFTATCPAATGSLAVRVVENVEFDPNGYSLSLDGAAPEFVPALFPGYEQTMRFPGLSVGVHRLSVSGVAAHCAASPPGSVAFTVSAGMATPVRIAIVCSTHGGPRAMPTAR
jgi:hypothetical protein